MVKYNAFGILSDDSDFLVHQFQPDVTVLSIKHLNLETLDTKAYDRQKLADHLGLEIKDLPLLATLKGNDFMHRMNFTHFHRVLLDSHFVNNIDVFPKLAVFIQKQGPYMDLDEFASKFFRNEREWALGRLQESLDSYKLQTEDILEPLGSLHVGNGTAWANLIKSKADYSSKVFQLMCGAPFVWGCCLEDYGWRNHTLPKSADLLKGPRQRMYGVLFREKPSAMNCKIASMASRYVS